MTDQKTEVDGIIQAATQLRDAVANGGDVQAATSNLNAVLEGRNARPSTRTPRTPERGMETVELKPCPFCGQQPEKVRCLELEDNDRAPRPHRVYRIECDGCNARQEAWSATWGDSPLPPEDDNDRKARAEAITAWNTRATPAPAASAPAGEERGEVVEAFERIVRASGPHDPQDGERYDGQANDVLMVRAALPAAEPRVRAEGEAMREACVAACRSVMPSGMTTLSAPSEIAIALGVARCIEVIAALPARDEARPDAGTQEGTKART